MIDVLLAAPSLTREADLIANAPAAGVRIVRRCVDAVDVLAAVASFPGAVPIISASLPRLVAATVERLGSLTVGLADDDEDAHRLRELGVRRIVRASEDPLWPSLVASAVTLAPEPAYSVEPNAVSTPTHAPAPLHLPAPTEGVIAVWGPPGAPGRTTVAVGLADALARRGRRVCIVDADTYAPSIGLALGIDGGGLTTACIRAESGPGTVISPCCSHLSSTLSVLSGIGMSQTWRELRPSSLVALWDLMRVEFDLVLVDIGSCIEDDDAGSPWTTRRNAAAVTALQVAVGVVAVADSSPLGAARLARSWPQVTSGAPAAHRVVVHNRAPRRMGDWQLTVSSLGVDAPIVSIPTDARGVESCWARAATLSEYAPRSPAARAMRTLASVVVPD